MAKARRVKNIRCEAPVIENARRIIMVRLEELLSWTPYIDDPVNVPEIHHMRIAAKRLRYTLELFRPILGKGTNGLIDEIKTSDDFLLEAADTADLYKVSYTAHKKPLERLLSSLTQAVQRLF